MSAEFWVIIAFTIIVFEIGYFVGRRVGTSDGILHIDTKNDDHDVYQFEMKVPIDDLPKRKHVWIKVDPNANLSDIS